MRMVVLLRSHPVVPVAGALTHSFGRVHGGDIGPWPCPSLVQVIHPPRHRYLAHADAQDKMCSNMPATGCGCHPIAS